MRRVTLILFAACLLAAQTNKPAGWIHGIVKVGRIPERMERLLRALSSTTEIEVEAKATVELKLQPVAIE